MDRLRTPYFIVAVAAMALAVLVETGTTFLLGGHSGAATAGLADQAAQLGVSVPVNGQVSQPSGLAIPYLALVDGVVLFVVVMMGAGLLVPDRVLGRVQGVVTLIVSLVLIVVSVLLLVAAIARLVLMVTLLFAVPFGTIAYLILFGFFPRSSAAAVLSVVMALKLVFGGALVLAQQRFLQNKGLVALALTSIGCNLVAAFLHGVVPGILVSITDAIGGIIFAVVAIVWAIVLLIGAIPAIVNAVRTTAQVGSLGSVSSVG